jgi:hypothetical protein
MYENLTDSYMLIPILGKIVLIILLPRFFNSNVAILFMTMFLQLILTTIPNLIRTEASCQCLNFKNISKAFIDGTIAYGAGVFIQYVLSWVPYVNIPVHLIYSIPIVGGAALWALFYTITYIFINMGNQDDKDKWCKPPGNFGRNMADTIFFWFFLGAALFVNIQGELHEFISLDSIQENASDDA